MSKVIHGSPRDVLPCVHTARMRSHRFVIESSRLMPIDAHRTLALLRDARRWPEWQPEIVKTEGGSSLDSGDIVRGRARMLGFDVDGQSVIDRVDASRVVQTAVVGVGMRITYEIEATGPGSRVTHRLESDLPRGPLGWFLSLALRRRLRWMQRRVLEGLAGLDADRQM